MICKFGQSCVSVLQIILTIFQVLRTLTGLQVPLESSSREASNTCSIRHHADLKVAADCTPTFNVRRLRPWLEGLLRSSSLPQMMIRSARRTQTLLNSFGSKAATTKIMLTIQGMRSCFLRTSTRRLPLLRCNIYPSMPTRSG